MDNPQNCSKRVVLNRINKQLVLDPSISNNKEKGTYCTYVWFDLCRRLC